MSVGKINPNQAGHGCEPWTLQILAWTPNLAPIDALWLLPILLAFEGHPSLYGTLALAMSLEIPTVAFRQLLLGNFWATVDSLTEETDTTPWVKATPSARLPSEPLLFCLRRIAFTDVCWVDAQRTSTSSSLLFCLFLPYHFECLLKNTILKCILVLWKGLICFSLLILFN